MANRTSSPQISIGSVKRDISSLINRVAFGGERILIVSRGKPKAALVSLDDFQRLEGDQGQARRQQRQAWLARTKILSDEILARRQGRGIDVDRLLALDRADLENRTP